MTRLIVLAVALGACSSGPAVHLPGVTQASPIIVECGWQPIGEDCDRESLP